jgi:competence protein ComEA
VYELDSGARVIDAVEAAGGALADARLASVNLARPITDGEQVLIPDEDDPVEPASPMGGSTPGASAGAAGAAVTGPLIDLNTADQTALETLPGIGPATAVKIIADRESSGPFGSPEELRRVSGIGEKKYEALKDLVCVR